MKDFNGPDIVFKNVWKEFPNAVAPTLAGLDFEVTRNSIHVLMGHSGSGKSVTLKHLLGLIKPDEGSIYIRGQDIGACGEYELRELRRLFGMLFQNSALFDGLNVYENLAFPLREHRPEMKESEILHRVESLLESVELEDCLEKMPSDLSGGMRKRVGLARAIALDPCILLFDEPTTGLDPTTAKVIDDLIVNTSRRLKATSLIISHDVHASLRIADFVSMIWKGKIIETATSKEFIKSENPVVRDFLVGAGVL
jgi:phospholipid/cholesterol/gamma-HCH transport system ATP-binding protein